MLNGRRVTDAETLKVVTMVYAGYINKNIVAQLQAGGCNAVGVTGADGNCIQAHKRGAGEVDYGFAGDIDLVNALFFKSLLDQHFTPVVAPITHDKKGQLLNTNADTIAQEIAKALSPYYETHLIYTFEKEGVLLDVNDDESVIHELTKTGYGTLKSSNKIFAGMIPKLDNAFAALQAGVERIVIGNGAKIARLISGNAGTNITHE
jgi:acetylglutamate kinase